MRPRVRRSVDPRLTPDGALYVLRGPDHPDLELGGVPELIARLLRLADGTRTVTDLATDLGLGEDEIGELDSALRALTVAGVLDDAQEAEGALTVEKARRFERQLAYFADTAGSSAGGLDAQRRLDQATVCLLGLGGLGAWVAWALACSGVGTLVGVDCDEVELSNLNRQILYSEADIGAQKADVAATLLTAFSSDLTFDSVNTRLDGPEGVREVIRGADFVVDSLDWPPGKITRWVTEACFAEGTPYMALSQHPPLIRIGPLYVPGETGCYACQEAKYRREYPLFAALEASEQLQAPSATFGPACGVVGTLAANEVVAWITGLYIPTCLGSAALLDLRTFELEREPVIPEPSCATCRGPAQAFGGLAGR